MLELSVAVRVARALVLLGVGLKAEAELPQEPAHELVAHLKTLCRQSLGEMTLALRNPPQGRTRIAPRRRLHQALQRRQQERLTLGFRLSAATGTADTILYRLALTRELAQTQPNGRARHTRGLANRLDAAPSRSPRLRRRKKPPTLLVQMSRESLIPTFYASNINHTHNIWYDKG